MDNIKEMIKMYNNGASLRKIGDTYGKDHKYIRTILNKNGVSTTLKTKHKLVKKDLKGKVLNDMLYMYNIENKSMMQIAKTIDCNLDAVIHVLKENGVDTSLREHNFQKYYYDDDYFLNIDREDKAYWLGFIIADGHVTKNNHVMIALQERDYTHLEKIKESIKSNVPVIKRETICQFTGKPTIASHIVVSSSKFGKNLMDKGVTNRKSWGFDVDKLLSFIPKELMRHFIRGYFDGDGSIGVYGQQRNKEKPLYNFSIVGLKELLDVFQKELRLPNITIRYDKRTENMYILKTGNIKDIHRIQDYLYNGATVYLERKYDIFKML